MRIQVGQHWKRKNRGKYLEIKEIYLKYLRVPKKILRDLHKSSNLTEKIMEWSLRKKVNYVSASVGFSSQRSRKGDSNI